MPGHASKAASVRRSQDSLASSKYCDWLPGFVILGPTTIARAPWLKAAGAPKAPKRGGGDSSLQSEDLIIHFSTELIHGPAPLRKDALQKLYFDLSQTRHGYDSTDFSNPAQWRFYSRGGTKTQSIAVFLPDRLVLIEEWAAMALSDFLERTREVAARTLEARGIPQFLAHTATIRSTFALTHFQDARVFLLDHVCQQAGRIGPHLQRPLAVGGLRFVLPETPEHPGNLHVIIESFRHSQHEVFVEVKGVFGKPAVDATQLDLVLENIRGVRRFVSDRIFPYLDQFDEPTTVAD